LNYTRERPSLYQSVGSGHQRVPPDRLRVGSCRPIGAVNHPGRDEGAASEINGPAVQMETTQQRACGRKSRGGDHEVGRP